MAGHQRVNHITVKKKTPVKIVSIATVLAAFMLMAILYTASGAEAAVTITRTSAPFFNYDKDTTPMLKGMYVSFNVYSDSAITDAWALIDNWQGSIALGNNAPNTYHIGPMAAGSNKTAYFYIKTTALADIVTPPGANQGHDVSVWAGNPAIGSQLARSSYTFNQTTVGATTYNAQNDSIEAQASKVSSVISGPTPATLGGVVTMTVSGDTGTTNGPFSFTPASDILWPANSYKLVNSLISLPNGTILTDTLYYGAYTGTQGAYVAVYTFVTTGTYSAPTATSPSQYINSGNVMKHVPTDAANIDGFIPTVLPSGSNSVVVSTSCTPLVVLPGAPVNIACSVTFTNSGTTGVALDDMVVVLPSSPGVVTYVSGTSEYNAGSIVNPTQSGSTLTWSGLFQVSAASSSTLTFSATIPNTTGNYQFSAIAHIGTAQIDVTALLGDNVPATCMVTMTNSPVLTKQFNPTTIGPTVGAVVQESTLTFTITNPSGNPNQMGLQFTETLPANLTWSGAATASQCGGTVTYSGAGSNIISFTGGSLAAGPSSCTITAKVKSGFTGTYNNTSANISANPAWLTVSAVNATLQVVPAGLTKDFLSNAILTNGTTILRYTITNAAGNPPQGGLAFTDTFPANLKWSGTATSPQCGGTVVYSGAGNNIVTFSGGTLAAGVSSCSIDVTVTSSSTAGSPYVNTDTNMSGFSASLSNNVTAQSLQVSASPTLNKAFSPNTIGVNQIATLTFTITSNSQASNPDFIDVFPLGLKLASATITNTSSNAACASADIYKPATTTPSAVGDGSIEFSASKIPANATCTYTVQVTGNAAGIFTNNSNNIIFVSNLTNAATDATLTIIAPTLTKAFGFPTAPINYPAPLTFTIANSSPSPAQGGVSGTGLGFTDSMPSGLICSATQTTSQCNGTLSCPVGTNVITFSGGSLANTSSSCTVAVNVTSATAGSYTNGSGHITNITTGFLNSVTNQTITFVPLPNITVLKSTQVVSDPVNNATNPKAIPGAQILYTLTATNFGQGVVDAGSMIITDPIPATVSLVVAGSPVSCTNGIPTPSGITFNCGAFNNAADDVYYSKDGTDWSYVPVPGGGNNTDPLVRYLQIKPPATSGQFNGASGGNTPSFTIRFSVVIN